LQQVAEVVPARGPSVIQRENGQRRLVLSANPDRPDLARLARDLEESVRRELSLPEGYRLSFEGEHVAQRSAQRRILGLFGLVLLVITVLLHAYFRSLVLALQVLVNLPLALMGGLAMTAAVVGNLSSATLIGFIAVGGIAARNGIMMLSHYLHLMRHEGLAFGPALIVRGTQERLVPVLMTALSAGLALIPLVRAAHEPGTEILHPVAVVIVGGLVSSTLLDLVVTPAMFWAFGRRAAGLALTREAPAAH
jgi:Cu/Ag efflux pump CusA